MRTRSSRKIIVNEEEESSSASSSGSEEAVSEDDQGMEASSSSEAAEEGCDGDGDSGGAVKTPVLQPSEKRRIKGAAKPITISLKKVCKVCKKTGHEAGFRGATYIDCPMKPCFLCKQPGHTTMTCPHRVAMEYGVVPSTTRRSVKTTLDYVFDRQTKTNLPMVRPKFAIPDQIDCGIIRFHSRRVTCLEFHPYENDIVLSGDKKGQIGIWKYGKLLEKTVYGSIHSCIVNNMKFCSANDGKMYASSSDGTLSSTDIETGVSLSLLNLNPNGWSGPANWRMLYGLDVNSERQLVLAADNFGRLYSVDGRSSAMIGESILIHRKGTKVCGLHCNPVQPDLFLSCGNDHFAQIWDFRYLKAGAPLARLAHGRVVNSAYFSPMTGSKIISTCQDNRIRVWDSVFGNLESPSREIVHSHDFNRHLTPFRAEWDPKDISESLVVVGRYISENYDGVALHPIDFIDISTGKLVAEVMDPDVTTISPVVKLHPREDALATGTSRSLFIWRPRAEEGEEEACTGKHNASRKKKLEEFVVVGKGGSSKPSKPGKDDDDDDDLEDFGTRKGSQKKKNKAWSKKA